MAAQTGYLMGNLSTVFHFASLAGLLVLVTLVLRLQVKLKLWRQWGGAASQPRVTVGEPIRVLRQFAGAVGADFESELPFDFLPPTKTKLDGCFELHRHAFIEAITVAAGESPCVFFILRSEPSTIGEMIQRLISELGGGVRIQFKKSE